MCYNVKALLWSQLKRAKRKGMYQDVDAIQQALKEMGVTNLYQASGFTHPKMMIYPDTESLPMVATWGLVPHWVKDNAGKVQTWNNTLNARGESIFEKPSLEGPRMPVILPDELADEWIEPTRSQKELNDLLLPFPDDLLTAHTVYKIAGKESKGNVPEAEEEFNYPEFKLDY
jgi:putative SOS response-associated peptidase YedK